MKIGDTLVLSDTDFYKEDKDIGFVEVTISEIRQDVPGMFGNGTHTGYKATDKKGNVYSLNWNSFPDDSMTPNWMWFDSVKAWFDPTVAYYTTTYPSSLVYKLVSKYPKSLGYCEGHNELYHAKDGCWKCNFGYKEPKPKKVLRGKATMK
jgi:hypothetical protein